MKQKHVSISLVEDGANFKIVAPLINTCQLAIGQAIERERVERWCTMEGVTVRIVSNDPEQAQASTPDLLADAPKSAPKARQRAPKALTAAPVLQIGKGAA